jgi:hypothetical protein
MNFVERFRAISEIQFIGVSAFFIPFPVRPCWCFSPTRPEPSPSYASAKIKKPMRFV